MKLNKKLAPIPLFVSLALTGCIEVDDDSNDGVVDALNQQNAVLTEQNNLLAEQLENSQTSVTLSGLVIGVDSETPVDNVLVTVYQGESVLAENVEADNGQFTIEGLPSSSDLTVVASTSDGSYMSRAYFITTAPVSTGEGFDDIGTLMLSEPVNVTFSVMDESTGEAISGLSFTGFSYSGVATSNVFDFAHSTTFNEETQQYDITLPKDLAVTLRADIDLDDDGAADFATASLDFVSIVDDKMYIYNANELDASEITLGEPEVIVDEEKSLSITLIDTQGNVLDEAAFIVEIEDETINSSFDSEAQVHEMTVPFNNYSDIEMPSFTSDDVTYSTGRISLSRYTTSQTNETRISVNLSGYDSNSYYSIADEETLNLVLVAREVVPSSTVEFITSNLNSDDFAYSVFYSEAVSIDSEEVSLVYEDVTVTRGNDSADDTVPAGYTYVRSTDREVSVTASQALGGIKHTFTPDEALQGNTSYRYEIGEVTPASGTLATELYEDEYSFTTPAGDTGDFDINSLVLDNFNYYTNGAVIVSENTAGVANPAYPYSRNVSVLLPTSIESLNYLILNTQSYSENGNVYTRERQYEIVRDGHVSATPYLALDVAENEIVDNNSSENIMVGTTATDGSHVYRRSINIYLEDNTADYPVTVTFSYEYQTKEGETGSGTMTLPVL
ncbi:hypothetical protein KUC3_26840 [Alteromonas sp. KC3]|uniref:hypothetical protein n=1 Tax=unclassified Alteromonas TaxID=2614992 RepID=UPI0019226D74|nr:MULTISPECIES: hypothetical protein [unclassified Alteromonas]BCO19827.1 hypothetical protein KUC3_26840 [Alteromonas sp. KC3]BCO23792.1 hypothetical protein KUC14_26610 [Alteromonas sp. KC14]